MQIVGRAAGFGLGFAGSNWARRRRNAAVAAQGPDERWMRRTVILASDRSMDTCAAGDTPPYAQSTTGPSAANADSGDFSSDLNRSPGISIREVQSSCRGGSEVLDPLWILGQPYRGGGVRRRRLGQRLNEPRNEPHGHRRQRVDACLETVPIVHPLMRRSISRTNSALSSIPTHRRLSCAAASRDVPEPAYGSSTTSPGSLVSATQRWARLIGIGAG